MLKPKNTSWQKSANWYGKVTHQGEGHYYHQRVIWPELKSRLTLTQTDSILDIGCGNGFLAQSIDPGVAYWGIDNAPQMIAAAKKRDHNPRHHYLTADATKTLNLPPITFTTVVFILSLQNMRGSNDAIRVASRYLKPQGKMIILLNHPCFRIPRQSGWLTDEGNKQQKRWINRYYSEMEIPILMHPGERSSEVTLSFHQPLSFYVNALSASGLVTTGMAELTSDKVSAGKFKKMENMSRTEIPLFLLIEARKV